MYTIVTILCIMFTANLQALEFTADSNTVALWHFNEGSGDTLHDASGNGNHGVINGATWVDGIEGKALSFDGIDDNVVLPVIKNNVNFTIEAWVNWTSTDGSEGYFISTDDGFAAILDSGKFYYGSWDSREGKTGTFIRSDSGGIVDFGLWNYVVIVGEDTNSLKSYLNGKLVHTNFARATATGTYSGINAIGSLYDNTSVNSFYTGKIDEIRISNIVRTATEIAAHWKVYTPDTSLVAYWNFNEGSGTILNDLSGNGNHGVINGATWVDGIEGKALEFDGVDDFVFIDDSPQWDSPTKTISVWAYPTTENDNGNEMKTIWREGADNSGFEVTYKNGEYQTGFIVSGWKSAKVPGKINEWTHIVAVNNGKNILIYKNGVVTIGDLSGGSSSGTRALHMGKWNSTGYDWHGLLDEVRIYNRSLTVTEVLYLYQNPGNVFFVKNKTPKLIPIPSPTLNRRPTFTWHPYDSTQIYTIQINDKTDFTNTLYTIPVGGTTYTSLTDLPIGTVYWRVKSDVNNIYSPTGSFIIQSDTIPFIIRYNGAEVTATRPEFKWYKVAGATQYRIEIDTTKLFVAPLLAYVVADTTVNPLADLQPAKYYWRVSSDLDYSLFPVPDEVVVAAVTTGLSLQQAGNWTFEIPNPAEKIEVSFTLEQAERLGIVVVNIYGQNVGSVDSKSYAAGVHTVQLRENVDPGIYFVKIKGTTFIDIRKILIVK